MSARSPHITLNNRVQMPAIGLGVFQTPPAETVGAVEAAIATGYRLIDTAAAYANEHEVGEGIRRSGVSRDEVFIETKIWISDYGYDSTLHAFDKSARKLSVDRIDLLLLHQPLPSAFDLTLEAYRALQKLLADGNTISPGIIITPLAKDELTGPRGEGYRRMIELCPVGRAGTPDEVGNVGALLMGSDGAFITGSDFLMDGGVTASYWFGELAPK
jgi:hypothetical protein